VNTKQTLKVASLFEVLGAWIWEREVDPKKVKGEKVGNN
jgi:hypothetical protein